MDQSRPTSCKGNSRLGYQHISQPKVVVGWLTLLFRVWEIPGLKLGPETAYNVFGGFPQSLQANAGIVP
jgi:hypothetical protein